MASKRWCETCKFMTYGNCHEVVEKKVPDDFRIIVPQRMMLVPFNSDGPIAGNATALVTAYPQLPGRPLHLAVDPNIASYFDILDIRFGVCSQTACLGKMAASIFKPQPEDKAWINNLQGLDPWQVGMILTLTVQNKAPHAVHFNAVIRGEIMDNPRAASLNLSS